MISCTASDRYGCEKVCSQHVPQNGRRFCRHELAEVLGAQDLEAKLEALQRLRVLRSWKIIGGIVFLEHNVASNSHPREHGGPYTYSSRRERVLVAAAGILRVADEDQDTYRRAWKRFRRAAFAWLLETAGTRGKVGKEAREWAEMMSTLHRPNGGLTCSGGKSVQP